MTESEWEDANDRELDARLTTLFQSIDTPQPPAAFLSRTMELVRQEPLPAGRRRLRRASRTWTTPLGWAAIVAGAASAAWGVGVDEPLVAEASASLVAIGIRVSLWLVPLVRISSAVFDTFAATSSAVASAAATREAAIALALMAVVSGLALSALNRLLFANNSHRESSSW